MAEEEEFEQQQLLVDSHVTSNRPERRIEVREHDTTKAHTEEIIEMAQTVLDTLEAQRQEQQKSDASMGDLGSAAGNANPAAGAGSVRVSSALSVAAATGPSHKDVATALKRKLDETLGGTWHVVVGSSFGGNVTNDEGSLVNFVVDGVYFLVLRSGPPERPAMVNASQEAEGSIHAK